MSRRVRVDLSNIFDDQRRSLGLCLLPDSLATVGEFRNRLANLFLLDEEHFYLFVDNCLVPDGESVEILQGIETVTLIPADSTKTKSKRKKHKKEHHDESGIEMDMCTNRNITKRSESTIKTHKTDDHTKINGAVQSCSKAIEIPRRSVTPMPISSTPKIIQSHIVYDSLPPPSSLVDEDVQESSSDDEYDDSLQNDPTDSKTTSEKRSRKRKRVRRQRRKKGNGQQVGQTNGFIAERLNTTLSVSSKPKTNTHIKFDGSDKEIDHVAVDKMDVGKPEAAKLEEGKPEKEKLEEEKLEEGKPEEGKSEVEKLREEKFEDDNLEVISNSDLSQKYFNSQPSDQTFDIEACRREIDKFPKMNSVKPKVNDVVGFKIHYLSESYTPEISEFIVAKIVSCDPEFRKVTTKILAGSEQLSLQGFGKFSLPDDSEEPNVEEDLLAKEFLWTELIEPRLLFP